MTTASPLGVFEEQVLLAVLRTSGESYGMAIRREIERVTERDVAIGAVYATLDRLEAKGLAASRRAPDDDGMSRRQFTVTRVGARVLLDTKTIRERLWRGVDLGSLLENR